MGNLIAAEAMVNKKKAVEAATGKPYVPTATDWTMAAGAGAGAASGTHAGGGAGTSGVSTGAAGAGGASQPAMVNYPPAPSQQPVAPAPPPMSPAMTGADPHLTPPTPAPMAPDNSPPGEGYGPGFGEQYGKAHVGQYDTPTGLETFAQQQLAGNNPYYDRLQQQGMAAINQQMASRGHYNSGGALSALGNYSGALGAAQFKDMGDLLGSAGSMQLNRQGQGQGVANSVQQQQQQRQQQQFGQLSDIAHLGAGNVGGFYSQGGQQSGDAAMAGINAGVDAAAKQGQGQNAFSGLGFDMFKSYLGGGKG